MKIIYTSKFEREYRKLPEQIKILAEEKEKIFRNNPLNPRLKRHKLHGKFKEFWSFSIDFKYRIVFEISKDKKTFYFHSVNDHNVYK